MATGNYDATEMWFDEELHEMKREGLIEIEENGGRLADDDVDVDFWLTELGENVCRKVLQTFEAGDTAECILKSLKSNHSLRIVYSQWAIGTYGVSSKEDERVVKGALFELRDEGLIETEPSDFWMYDDFNFWLTPAGLRFVKRYRSV